VQTVFLFSFLSSKPDQNNPRDNMKSTAYLGTPLNQPQTRLCPACGHTCHRQTELDRHLQSFHLPPWIFCPYSGCRWRGTRVADFQRHLNTQRCGPSLRLEEQQYQIYNVKMILSWIKDSQGGNIVSIAQRFAVDLVKERALELRKHDWLEDPWGCSA